MNHWSFIHRWKYGLIGASRLCYTLFKHTALYGARFLQAKWSGDQQLVDMACAAWWKGLALDNGIVTRKMAQTLACDEHLFPSVKTRDALAELCDEVERMSEEQLEAALVRAYGTNWQTEGPFLVLDRVAMNSGCTAQILRACLKESVHKMVVVKVYRDGIREQIENQVIFFEYLLYFVLHSALPVCSPYWARLLRKGRVWQRFVRLKEDLLDQTESEREVQNLQVFRGICGFMNYIHIPHVYTEHCRPGILVEEFIHGVPLRTLRAPEHDVLRPIVCKHLMWFYLRSMFQLKKHHGDGHAGNIRVRLGVAPDDGHIAIYDLGLMHSKSSWQLEMLGTLLEKLYKGDWLNFIIHMFDMLVESDTIVGADAEECERVRLRVWLDMFTFIRAAVCRSRPTVGFFKQLFEHVADQPHVVFRLDFADLDLALLNMDMTMKQMDPRYPTFQTLYELMSSHQAQTTTDDDDKSEQEQETPDTEVIVDLMKCDEDQIRHLFQQRVHSFQSTKAPTAAGTQTLLPVDNNDSDVSDDDD